MCTDTAWFFDLDDTLYKEHTFVASAYRAVARYMSDITGADPDVLAGIMARERPRGFEAAIEAQRGLPGDESISIDSCVDIYRRHWPEIRLDDWAVEFLGKLKKAGAFIGIISDGTVLTQGTKIRALGLEEFVSPGGIFISEAVGGDKTTVLPWTAAEALCRERGYRWRVYVGDNLRKDFLLPNLRGWQTVMLRDSAGVNIFPQKPLDWPPENRAKITLLP